MQSCCDQIGRDFCRPTSEAIVHLLFRTSAMHMYSSPCVSDRTPNPSCCTYSRALSLGKPKITGSPHRAYRPFGLFTERLLAPK